jgi:sugar lactone lactonase YvrE
LLLVFAGNISCGNRDETYKKPESFIVDPETGEYFVSNVNGVPAERDNNGYITRLDKNLKVVNKEFVKNGTDGIDLNAPKGLAIVGDVLYVTDISSVRGYNKRTGKNVADINLKDKGAIFLNDIVADKEGNIFVSDMTANIIYRIETANGNKISELYKGQELDQPNGLIFDPKTGDLLIASWGGKVLQVGKDGKISPYVAREFVRLDGIDFDNDGNIYVSSFQLGEIYKLTPDKQVTTIKKGLKSPADISVDRAKNLLLIPLMGADKIETFDLKSK